VVRFWARVVFPVQGVPVMRMTRFMLVIGCMDVVIAFACLICYARSSL
jgi:hypothetical protein